MNKITPAEDQRLSKATSEFMNRLNIADYHPAGLAYFCYYQGRMDELLEAKPTPSTNNQREGEGEKFPFGLSEDQVKQLLDQTLKPEEISGIPSIQHDRVRELVYWFLRFSNGDANPKWFRSHAYELAYFIATNAGNRFIDLSAVKQKAWLEGVKLSPADRATLERVGAIPKSADQPTETPSLPVEPEGIEFKAPETTEATRKEGREYPFGGYAPGTYWCRCVDCKKTFWGDKRAIQCEPCAERAHRLLKGHALPVEQVPERSVAKGPWKVEGHSYSVGDTGDYDGYWELNDGKIAIFTKDDPEDGACLQKIVDALNESGCRFYLDDSANFLAGHFEQEYKNGLSEIDALRTQLAEYKRALVMSDVEITAMYKRVGFKGSNILDLINNTLQKFKTPNT